MSMYNQLYWYIFILKIDGNMGFFVDVKSALRNIGRSRKCHSHLYIMPPIDE